MVHLLVWAFGGGVIGAVASGLWHDGGDYSAFANVPLTILGGFCGTVGGLVIGSAFQALGWSIPIG